MKLHVRVLLLLHVSLQIQHIASFSFRPYHQLTYQPASPSISHITKLNAADTSTSTNSKADIDTTLSPPPPTVTVTVPPNILGPPETLRDLQIGQTLKAFRNNYGLRIGKDTNFTIERVSYTPDAFVLRNFLTESECDEIQTMAKSSIMTQAETITQNDTSSRRNCQVAWLPSGSSTPDPTTPSLVASLVASAANILLSPGVLGHPSAGVEDLQVLKYGVGGEFVLHHDGEPRVLTVIYYVNGVGGTWFPLARTSNDIRDDPCADMNCDMMEERFASSRNAPSGPTVTDPNSGTPQNKSQALDLGKDRKPGSDGLLVKGAGGKDQNLSEGYLNNEHVALIRKGDAIAFYNYDDTSARLNWKSLHCGLPTTEEDGDKWIANHWFRLNDLTLLE